MDNGQWSLCNLGRYGRMNLILILFVQMKQNAPNMHTVQLRNLPEETYRALKNSAEKSRRSITQQAIYLIQQALEQMAIEEEYHQRKLQAFQRIKNLDNRHIYNNEKTLEWIREGREK